jgi:hypothetical protein
VIPAKRHNQRHQPNLRTFAPPERAANNVRQRTYSLDKQADTG